MTEALALYRPTGARDHARVPVAAGDRRARQPMPAHLATTVREARARAGLTQQQLAEKVGVAQQTVSDWETGRRWPGVLRIPRLAEVLRLGSATARALDRTRPKRRRRRLLRLGLRAGWRLIHEPESMARRTLAKIDRASGRRGKGGRPKRRARLARWWPLIQRRRTTRRRQ